jgi:hypothetical protein
VALLILVVGDQEPERKTQGEVLLNAYSRELERRRLAAGAQGLLHVSGGRMPPTFCSAFLLSFPQRATPSLMKMIQMKSSTTLGLPLQTRHHVHPHCVSRRQTTLAARPRLQHALRLTSHLSLHNRPSFVYQHTRHRRRCSPPAGAHPLRTQCTRYGSVMSMSPPVASADGGSTSSIVVYAHSLPTIVSMR